MKKLFLIVLAVGLASFGRLDTTTYCKGFEQGFRDGYCYDVEMERPDPLCPPPVTPVCPVPKPFADTFKDGYQIGFLRGIEAQKGY